MSRWKTRFSVLILLVVCTGWSCKVFLGAWGQEGDPCLNESQCNNGFTCFEPAKICLSSRYLDKLRCKQDDQPGKRCEDRLGSTWHCQDETCSPQDPDQVRWCMGDTQSCDQGQTCAQDLVCSNDLFWARPCDQQQQVPCGNQPELLCTPFQKPGQNEEQYFCTKECNTSADCPENYSCTLGAEGLKRCAKKEWTDGFGVLCETNDMCSQENSACVQVQYGSPQVSEKICTEACGDSCTTGYSCCRANEGSDAKYCLMGYLCDDGCEMDCSGIACGMDHNNCGMCDSCPIGQQCKNGTCIIESEDPAFPLVLDLDENGIGAIGSVSVSGQNTNGIVHIAHSGTTIDLKGASIWDITVNPTGTEHGCQAAVPCVTGGPYRFFEDSSKTTQVSYRWDENNLIALGKVELLGWQIWNAGEHPPGHTISTLSFSYGSMLLHYPQDNIAMLAQTNSGTLEFDKISFTSENNVVQAHVNIDTGDTLSDVAISEKAFHSFVACTKKVATNEGKIAIVDTQTDSESLTIELFQGEENYKSFSSNCMAVAFVPNPDEQKGSIVVALDKKDEFALRIFAPDQSGKWTESESFSLPHSSKNIVALCSTIHPSYERGVLETRVLLGLEDDGDIVVWTIDENSISFIGTVKSQFGSNFTLGTGDITVSPVDRSNPGDAYIAASGEAKILVWPLKYFLKKQIGFGFPCLPGSNIPEQKCTNEDFPYCEDTLHICVKKCTITNDCPEGFHCSRADGYCLP